MKRYNISRFYLCLLCILVVNSCIQKDKFGLSPFNDIISFEIPGQAGSTSINLQERSIVVPMNEEADLSNLTPSQITISNLATIEPREGESQNFTTTITYTVTAENGEVSEWNVSAVPGVPNPQLENSNFDSWYTVGDYEQPGISRDNTIWDTANRGLTIVADPNTIPEDLGGGDFAAKMTSVRSPLLVRMAAATLFTGKFTEGFPDPRDPRSNIDFGVPFAGRPNAFRVDYRYLPGDAYEDGDGNTLPGGDECDIYILLQRRENGEVKRIGTGWFRDDTEVNDWTTLEVPIKYGELTAADPEFEYANIRTDEGESWGDANSIPTHIVVVFSSSALGDFFTGAIGSELWVNDLELIY
jgi:hypothetical protein